MAARRSDASASSALAAVCARRPSEVTHRDIRSRTAGSSSTMRTEVTGCHRWRQPRQNDCQRVASRDSVGNRARVQCAHCAITHTIVRYDVAASAHVSADFPPDSELRAPVGAGTFLDPCAVHETMTALKAERPLLLVVDDEIPVLKVVERLAARIGFDVVTCASGAEAMRTLHAQAGRPGDGRPAHAGRERARSAAANPHHACPAAK